MMRYVKELYLIGMCCIGLSACSEADEKEEWTPGTHVLSVRLGVEQGDVLRGVDEGGVLEANYPLSEVYMWIDTSEGWKTIALPCTEGGVDITVIENEDGTVTVVRDEESVTFTTADNAKFASLDYAEVTLPSSSVTTPGGKSTYGTLPDDMIFKSSVTTWKYNLAAHTFSSGRNSLANGLTMVRYGSVIYVNVIVTSLTDGVQDGNVITYTFTEEDWLREFGATPGAWSVRGFLSGYPYEYNWDTNSSGDARGIVALADTYINLQSMGFQHTDSGGNMTSYYNGIGAHSKQYLYIFPTTVASYLNFSFNDPLMGSCTSTLDDSPLVFGRNNTYILDIVYDWNEIYNAPFARNSRAWGGEVRPSRIYVNGNLIVKDK